jgi:hypothetical protein
MLGKGMLSEKARQGPGFISRNKGGCTHGGDAGLAPAFGLGYRRPGDWALQFEASAPQWRCLSFLP